MQIKLTNFLTFYFVKIPDAHLNAFQFYYNAQEVKILGKWVLLLSTILKLFDSNTKVSEDWNQQRFLNY